MSGIIVLWVGPAIDSSWEQWLTGCHIDYRAFGVACADGQSSPSLILVNVIGAPAERAVALVRQCAATVTGPAVLIAVTLERGSTTDLLAAGAHDVVSIAEREEMWYRLQRWRRFAEQRKLCTRWARHALDLGWQLTASMRELDALRAAAQCDAVTGLANRRRFEIDVGYAISFAERYGGCVSLIMADVDGFAGVNDAAGRAGGDAALRQIARLFVTRVRRVDHVARVGSDELAVILPHTGLRPAADVAERLRVTVEMLQVAPAVSVTVSLGVAAVDPAANSSGESLIERADRALGVAKQAGKNRVVA